jgi:hypothetical protein
MLKFPIAMAIGLTVAGSAASADVIVIQGTPSHGPAILSHGPLGPLPGDLDLSQDIFDMPAFHRLAEMCETLGLDCDAEHATAEGGILPEWTPRHIADAEKRLALLMQDREDLAEALEEHFDSLPQPRPANPLPFTLFGWNTLPGRPYIAPHDLDDLLAPLPRPALPHRTLPRPVVPHPVLPRSVLPAPVTPRAHDLSGFYHRLNTPGAALPRGMMPRTVLPRHSFPWRPF